MIICLSVQRYGFYFNFNNSLGKRDLSKLPYLLEEVKCKGEEIKCKQKESMNSENANIFPVQMELSLENADIFRQSKVKESKVEEKKKREEDSVLPPPPEYALNKKTHNYDGLLLTLDRIKVTDTGDIKAILRMSNYGGDRYSGVKGVGTDLVGKDSDAGKISHKDACKWLIISVY